MGCSSAVCLLFGLTQLAADPKRLDVPAERTNVTAALIAKWDADDVTVREKASADLTAMGREALPALLTAAKGKPSAEVTKRLSAAVAVARSADFEARYPLFLADKEGKYEHDFLGWTELRAAVKDTKDSRLLFRDILEDINCRDLLLHAMDPSTAARKKFEQRWEDKSAQWERARPLNKGEPRPGETIEWLAAAFLTDLMYGRDYWAESRPRMVMLFTTHTDEGRQLRSVEGRHGAAMLDLVRQWVERQEGQWGIRDAELVIKALNLREEDRRALVEKNFRLLVERKVNRQSGESIRNLAYTRDPAYIPRLRLLFENQYPHKRRVENEPLPEIQTRDAALSMVIALSGQDPTEYGFTAHEKATAKDRLRYWADNYCFDGKDETALEAKRVVAFKRWAEWEKANPDAIKAKPPEKKDK